MVPLLKLSKEYVKKTSWYTQGYIDSSNITTKKPMLALNTKIRCRVLIKRLQRGYNNTSTAYCISPTINKNDKTLNIPITTNLVV